VKVDFCEIEQALFMDAINRSKIGIIILAAGASTRLGRPKQLLKFRDKTLIEKIAETALKTNLNTVVVLGANAEKIKTAIENLPVKIAINENWQSGMASSIVTGLEKSLEIEPNLSAVILLLCDQPFITKATILRLVESREETNKTIIASEYKNMLGVPALFSREVFKELLNLEGDVGARFLIKKYESENLAKISVPEAAFDIDTEEDFERVLNF
jgi:molybdenum cofactor cytidylyltransferase